MIKHMLPIRETIIASKLKKGSRRFGSIQVLHKYVELTFQIVELLIPLMKVLN